MAKFRRVLAALVAASGLGASGCTLCKPVVGAVTGPVVMLANSGGLGGGGCNGNGEAVVCLLAMMSAVGAVGGLVTGIISDVQVLTGSACEPCRNWADPFRTNTSN